MEAKYSLFEDETSGFPYINDMSLEAVNMEHEDETEIDMTKSRLNSIAHNTIEPIKQSFLNYTRNQNIDEEHETLFTNVNKYTKYTLLFVLSMPIALIITYICITIVIPYFLCAEIIFFINNRFSETKYNIDKLYGNKTLDTNKDYVMLMINIWIFVIILGVSIYTLASMIMDKFLFI